MNTIHPAISNTWKNRFWSVRSARLGVFFLFFLIAVALLADFLASDLPIMAGYKGKIYFLPNIFRPTALQPYDNHSLRQEFTENDWALWPLIPYGPEQAMVADRLETNRAPGRDHLLGTDPVGRDVSARIIHGVRPALATGLLAVSVSILLGSLLGVLGGYFPGIIDSLVSWATAVTLTFPALLLVLTLGSLSFTRTWWGLGLLLGIVGWAPAARLVRGQTRRVRNAPYILAARATGASELRILTLHILPNTAEPIVVMAAFGIGWAVLMESALSFLGAGGQTASWGDLLASARSHPQAWWLTLFAGLCLFFTVLACNTVAEGLRRALNPKSRQPWIG